MSTPTRGSDLLNRVTATLAALASVAAFVYLVGAGVLWIRLYRKGLPTEAVITSLPRELLLSVGLRSIFLPALVFAVLAALVLVLVGKTERGRQGAEKVKARVRERSQGFLLALSMLAVLAFGLLWWLGPNFWWALGWTLGGLSVFVTCAVIPTWIGRVTSPGLILRIAVLIGAAATLVRLGVEFATPQFEVAAVCVQGVEQPYKGLFIGETDNGIYLGRKPMQGEGRVIEVPRDRFSEVWIGTETVDCTANLSSATGGKGTVDSGNATAEAKRAAAEAKGAAAEAKHAATKAARKAAESNRNGAEAKGAAINAAKAANEAAERARESKAGATGAQGSAVAASRASAEAKGGAAAASSASTEAKDAAAAARGASAEAKDVAAAAEKLLARIRAAVGRAMPRWPIGVQRLANGRVSIPVGSVNPAHLKIVEVSFSPDPLRSHQPVTASFRVKDTRGFVVRDALVYVFGLPEGNFLPAEEKRTNPEGLVQIVLRPTSKVVLKDGAHVVLFVRARDPADELLAGVSARRLVRLRLAAPKG